MRLSSYTDYALRTLVFLALRPDELATIHEIAETYEISRNHLMKVVQQLSLLGFVESVRGRGGGLRLGRPAEDIRIGDVVRATEQDLDIVECFSPPGGAGGLPPDVGLRAEIGAAGSPAGLPGGAGRLHPGGSGQTPPHPDAAAGPAAPARPARSGLNDRVTPPSPG